jgi:hypothetical protein
MRRVRILASLLLSASNALAAPFAVQVGEARLALDAPPGFADVQAMGSPRLFELAESLTSPSNRILLFALEDADVRHFSVGDSLELRRYVIVVTPKSLEDARTTLAAFHALVADALRELGPPAPASSDVRQYLDAQARGRPGLIAELRKDQELVTVLQGARLPEAPRAREARYLLSTMTLMLVRGKALNLAIYTSYAGDADLEWIRGTTLRWIDELQRLNLR